MSGLERFAPPRLQSKVRRSGGAPRRVNALTWLDLKEGEVAQIAGMLMHAGSHGFSVGFGDKTVLSVLANDARDLRALINAPITIDTFKLESRMHATSADISRCLATDREVRERLIALRESVAAG